LKVKGHRWREPGNHSDAHLLKCIFFPHISSVLYVVMRSYLREIWRRLSISEVSIDAAKQNVCHQSPKH
jgi:uncharacterized membrane protein YoaT (DUF817 family)